MDDDWKDTLSRPLHRRCAAGVRDDTYRRMGRANGMTLLKALGPGKEDLHTLMAELLKALRCLGYGEDAVGMRL